METGKLSFNQPYLNFMLSLVDFSKAKRILLVTGIIDLSDLPIDVREKVTTISLESIPSEALKDESEFDLTIIVPNFGRVSRGSFELPPMWKIPDNAAVHIEDHWLAWGIHATRQGGQLICVTSRGMLNSTLRRPIREQAINHGLQKVISLGSSIFRESSVNTVILLLCCGEKSNSLTLADVSKINGDIDWIKLGNQLGKLRIPPATEGIWSVEIPLEDLSVNLRLDPDFYHPRYLQIEAPEGYSEFLLSEIAEIRGGRPAASFDVSDLGVGGPDIAFIQVSNITPEGELSLESARKFPLALHGTSQSGWAVPGDILITTSGTLGKVYIIPPEFTNGLYYDTSIRRVRVNIDITSPRVVYDFLRSEAAQLQISRYSSGSVIPIISTPDLGSIRIFLPEKTSQATSEETVTLAKTRIREQYNQAVAKILQERVINPLLYIDQAQTYDWRDETVQKLREIMQQIQKDHEPLDELVTRSYPLPIAIAYRRLTRAYHNPYEQVNRMTELYEALTHFFYYVLFSNFLQDRELQQVFQPVRPNKFHANAYKNFSMDHRLKFIKGLLEKVKQKNSSIFIPELLSIDPYTPLEELRKQRNVKAHSTSGTAAAQKALFEENWPLIENLLKDLRFLKNYPLCRIDSYYNRGNNTYFRIEYFQGALYETDYREQEAPVSDDGQIKLIRADSSHVILLNPQFDWLDLHPFYQVITSKEYRYESHLCFHKQIQDGSLFGESIQFRTEFSLPGYDDLQQLTKSAGL